MRILACYGEQGAHAGLHFAGANAVQAFGNEDPVVAVQRHNVGNRTQSHQINEMLKIRLFSVRVSAFGAECGAHGD